DQPLSLAPAPEEFLAAEPRERRHETAPVRAQLARRQRHLVVVPGDRAVGELELLRRDAHAGSQRRSSVSGCCGLCSGAGTATAPGVCPNAAKREPRRASASLELTGKVS